MNPHHLHATAAAWSLHTAIDALAPLARAERSAATEPRDGLRSPTPSIGRNTGGHGDPTGNLLTAPTPIRRLAMLEERVTVAVDWIANTLRLPYGLDDGLTRIIEAIPAMQPGTAASVTRHLVEEDDRIRTAIGMDRAGVPLFGECPACRCRSLRAYLDGPEEMWTVVCDRPDPAPCRCVGAGCRCGQEDAVEGVVHIWPRTQVLGAIETARSDR